MARTPLMAGNWKMNLNHLEAIALVQKLAFSLTDRDLDAVEVAVLPPFTDIRSVQTLVDGDKYRIAYGAQDVSPHASGAYTGDVSAAMLAKLGCTYVTVGHSERRQHHGEDDALVGAKAKAVLGQGMKPILCVGEALEVRKAGKHVEHTLGQLSGALEGLPPSRPATSSSPTSRCGPSGPERWPLPRTRRRSVRPSASESPSSTRVIWPTGSAFSMAARSRRPTRRPSWPQRTLTGRWSAGRASTRRSSSGSSGSSRSRLGRRRPEAFPAARG